MKIHGLLKRSITGRILLTSSSLWRLGSVSLCSLVKLARWDSCELFIDISDDLCASFPLSLRTRHFGRERSGHVTQFFSFFFRSFRVFRRFSIYSIWQQPFRLCGYVEVKVGWHWARAGCWNLYHPPFSDRHFKFFFKRYFLYHFVNLLSNKRSNSRNDGCTAYNSWRQGIHEAVKFGKRILVARCKSKLFPPY